MLPDDLLQILKRHAVQLMEHCDTVQIICTRISDETTESFTHGQGNYYARLKSTESWVKHENKTSDEGDYEDI